MKLNAKHYRALELVANPLDTRSNEAKAREAGISFTTLWRALKEPEAVEYVNRRTTELIRTIRPEAYQCLMRGIRAGDRAAARDALQATGDIGTGGSITHVNVEQHAGGRKEETIEEAAERIQRERAGLSKN